MMDIQGLDSCSTEQTVSFICEETEYDMRNNCLNIVILVKCDRPRGMLGLPQLSEH